MDKLICETRTTLRMISENPDIKIKALTDLVKKEVIITLSEVTGYAKALCNKGLISKSKNGSFTATQAGIDLLGKCELIKINPVKTNNRHSKIKSKEDEMKGLNPKLQKSLASLREKLETKPLQEVKEFDMKVELLDQIKTLPGVDDALAGLLTDISKDLSDIQAAATK